MVSESPRNKKKWRIPYVNARQHPTRIAPTHGYSTLSSATVIYSHVVFSSHRIGMVSASPKIKRNGVSRTLTPNQKRSTRGYSPLSPKTLHAPHVTKKFPRENENRNINNTVVHSSASRWVNAHKFLQVQLIESLARCLAWEPRDTMPPFLEL